VELNIPDLVAEYVAIRDSVVGLSLDQKTVADQETLDFWNQEQAALFYGESAVLKSRAGSLFVKVKAVRDAGLLPAEYEDEYAQLDNFVNG
jgi:hypothetical protein